MNGAGAAGEVGKRRGMAWAGFILSRGTDPTALMDRGGRIVDRCDEAVGASGSYLRAKTRTRSVVILDASMCSRLVEKSARYRDCRQGARMSVSPVQRGRSRPTSSLNMFIAHLPHQS